MKKILIFLVAFGLSVAGVVSAYTIQSGDTPFGLWGDNWKIEMQNQIGHTNQYALPVGVDVIIDEMLGSNPIPTDDYDSFLTSPLSASASTVYVNDLPTGVSSTIYTLFASDGVSPREKIYCSGTATSPNQLTGCTRGVSFSPSSGTIDESAGTGLSHSKNTRIAITDNINFSGKAIAILNGSQSTGATAFDVGETSTTSIRLYADSSHKYLYSHNGDTNEPFLRYNESTNKWQWSEDGSNTYNFTSSSISTLTASSSAGIGITDSEIYINASSTTGMTFDDSGALYQKTQSATGIESDSNGIKINTSTLVDLIATSTPTASKIPIADGSGRLDDDWLNYSGFGDGSDGDVTISSDTTLTSDMYYDNLTIDAGATLTTGGYIIFVRDTLTNNGIITVNQGLGGSGGTSGSNAGGGGGGSGGSGGTIEIIAQTITGTGDITANGAIGGAGGSAFSSGESGGGDGGDTGTLEAGINGVAGGDGESNDNGNAGGNGTNNNPSLGSDGSAGGNGGNGSYSAGAGGTAGTATTETVISTIGQQLLSSTATTTLNINLLKSFLALGGSSKLNLSTSAGSGGGGAGGGGAANIGGGGGGAGGSGGVIILIYKTNTLSGDVTAIGGAGGAGGAGAGTGSPGVAGTSGVDGKIYKLDID